MGTRAGTIDLYALGPGTMLQSYDAHEGAVWTVALRPDKRGFASGSADAKLKFWDFDLVKKPAIEGSAGASGAQLELTHTRTLTMTDEVLCVCYSNTTKEDELLICVALLDSTVKVFFDDTLKFFLSLYGHKLPVMAMDVSSDNSVLVTASADKVSTGCPSYPFRAPELDMPCLNLELRFAVALILPVNCLALYVRM